MKYPQAQYAHLLQAITTLSGWFDIAKINPSQLHYLVFQQYSGGQTHNWIYVVNGELIRAHKLSGNIADFPKLLPDAIDFKLYPDGCNDSHIETAVKRAVKEILTVTI